MKLPTPRPVSINEVCSECGEQWALHPEHPTLLDCVRLLKTKPSTTIVTSPCNCWCHHTLTYPSYPTIPMYPVVYSTATGTATDFQLAVSNGGAA